MKYGKTFDLYRDDGLGVIKVTARDIETIKKDLCVIFNKYGLKVAIEANIIRKFPRCHVRSDYRKVPAKLEVQQYSLLHP